VEVGVLTLSKPRGSRCCPGPRRASRRSATARSGPGAGGPQGSRSCRGDRRARRAGSCSAGGRAGAALLMCRRVHGEPPVGSGGHRAPVSASSRSWSAALVGARVGRPAPGGLGRAWVGGGPGAAGGLVDDAANDAPARSRAMGRVRGPGRGRVGAGGRRQRGGRRVGGPAVRVGRLVEPFRVGGCAGGEPVGLASSTRSGGPVRGPRRGAGRGPARARSAGPPDPRSFGSAAPARAPASTPLGQGRCSPGSPSGTRAAPAPPG